MSCGVTGCLVPGCSGGGSGSGTSAIRLYQWVGIAAWGKVKRVLMFAITVKIVELRCNARLSQQRRTVNVISTHRKGFPRGGLRHGGAAATIQASASCRSISDSVKPRILVFLLTLAAALFTIAFFVTRAFHAEESRLARQWSEKGDVLLAAQPAAAAAAFRAALLYDRDNEDFQFKLAQALAASGRTKEAEAYLHNLWDGAPENAPVNLELARLAARRGDNAEAVRFFHGAIYGVWPAKAEERRNQARRELVHYLLDHNQTTQADAETIALAAEVPDTASAHQQIAALFLQVRDDPHVLAEYQRAAELDPADAAALAGAGQAAFRLAEYSVARQYLRQAIAGGSGQEEAAHTLAIIDAMFALDPQAPQITAGERNARILRAYRQAGERLQQCAAANKATGQPLVDSWQRLGTRLTGRKLRRDPALAKTTMDLVFRIEQQAEAQCGRGTAADTALALLARRAMGGKS